VPGHEGPQLRPKAELGLFLLGEGAGSVGAPAEAPWSTEPTSFSVRMGLAFPLLVGMPSQARLVSLVTTMPRTEAARPDRRGISLLSPAAFFIYPFRLGLSMTLGQFWVTEGRDTA